MLSSCRRIPPRLNIRALFTKPSEYGQPTSLSHPHLVKHGELTPGIPASDYERRRQELMKILPDNSLVVMVAAPIKYIVSGQLSYEVTRLVYEAAMSSYKHRQSSDLWYLTGFEEPDSAVILEKNSSSRGYRMTLFSSGTDLAKAKWSGANTGHSAAKNLFQTDDVLSINNFVSHLKSLPHYSNVYVDLPNTSIKSPRSKAKWLLPYLSGLSSSQKDLFEEQKPLAPHIGKLRAIKSPAEQTVMRAAADISAHAHTKTMRYAQPGMSEHVLAAHFEYLCALGGAQRPAYVPVVASGPNSLILHYTHNNQLIEEGELVLVDAGCEYNGYASDITRTFPVSGTFTPPQRDLYNAVLSAQKQMIKLCSESSGNSLQDLHRKTCNLLKKELNQLGFSLGNDGDLERVLFPHYVGHPIGIDLHESAHIDRPAPLKKNMVITIEPGVYVPPTTKYPKHFHNLGIRIEDVVLVDEKDATVLSVSAPKEIVDVEGACQGVLGLQPY